MSTMWGLMDIVLHVEDHADTDYPDVEPRKPIVRETRHSSIASAIQHARGIQSNWRGHHITDITNTNDGQRLHVSQNGQVWTGHACDDGEHKRLTHWDV